MYNLKRKQSHSMSDVLLLLLFGVLAALLIISYAPIFNASSPNNPSAAARSIESASARIIDRTSHYARPTDVEPTGYNVMVSVWEDVNGNGRRDSDEPSLPNIEVSVAMDGSSCADHPEVTFKQCVGVSPFARLTDEDGQAILAGLAPPAAATGTTKIWVQLPDISDQYLVTYNSDGSGDTTHLLPWPAMPSGVYNAISVVYVPKRVTWGLQRK